MASKRQMGYKCRIAGVVLLLLGSVAALVAVIVIQDKWSLTEYTIEYGIVIDSGSSRSNVYLYEWPGEKQNETGVVTETMNCRVSGDPIAQMDVDLKKDAETWKGFKACMDNITAAIPVSKHKTTQLFLGATAGMRLLHVKDEQRSNRILASLREYLSKLPFNFQNASIITGQEEGLYGWITVNYLMGNFFERNLWNALTNPDGARTVGSMDLGGASTQIAFAVQDDLFGPDYLHVKLYGYPYNVYTHSFLCYGKHEAEKRILDKIVKASSDPVQMYNPCYPEGFNTSMNYSYVYDNECTTKPDNFNPDRELSMTGTGNSEECESIVKSLFDFKTCSSDQCSFDGVEQPPVTGDFMAYAGFYFTSKALQLDGRTDLDEFHARAKDFCETHWTVLRRERPKISPRYLKTYCYSAHYVFSLLLEGYKFDKETWRNINFEREVKGTSIGWSLGYMLSSSNMIPSEMRTVLPLTDPLFAGLVFLFSALAIVLTVVVFVVIIRACY